MKVEARNANPGPGQTTTVTHCTTLVEGSKTVSLEDLKEGIGINRIVIGESMEPILYLSVEFNDGRTGTISLDGKRLHTSGDLPRRTIRFSPRR